MLADVFFRKRKTSFTARLSVDHAYPEQEGYVLSLYTLFSPLIGTKPAITERKPDLRTGKVYKSIHLKTLRFCLNN